MAEQAYNTIKGDILRSLLGPAIWQQDEGEGGEYLTFRSQESRLEREIPDTSCL